MFKRTMLWTLCLLVMFVTLAEAQRPPRRTRQATQDSSDLYLAGTRVGRLPQVVIGDSIRGAVFETLTGAPITGGGAGNLVAWDGTWNPMAATNYGMTLFCGDGSPNIPVLLLVSGGYGADGGFAIYLSRPASSTDSLHIFFAYSGDTNPIAGTGAS